ncbi:(2Fe-2S)-binding protein [Desulfonatronum thioautotrophicum]|uniref:(2Fe-2S)-binding protein n=1 Tax=Desulfonatronum thioautotrophicum TaxID=617001 RepID=UPI000A03CEE3|nr:(2Fe-2S)-binding protein [Desulfonatronum thioautotrophicum]
MSTASCATASRPKISAGQESLDSLVICRCEEITRGEILAALENGVSTVSGVKRVTRAGMGLCQGQTCGRLVTSLVAGATGLGPDQVEPLTARPPVRPVPMAVLARDRDETAMDGR